jgi:prepilin-type N-terminal cleavage/methylation domain-containing protein
MLLRKRTQRSGFTLLETVVATGVFAVLSAASVTGVISLQRNFSNTTDFAVNHSAQLRISDHIARDLRQALSCSQAGTGSSLVITLTVPNYYTTTGAARLPVVNTDGSVSYQDTATPPKKASTIRYFITKGTMYREVDGAARPIAEDVAEYIILAIDSTVDPNAAATFSFNGISGKVAAIKVQVNFRTRFGKRAVTQTFYNTTLMRNARTDAQTNLY